MNRLHLIGIFSFILLFTRTGCDKHAKAIIEKGIEGIVMCADGIIRVPH